MAAGLYARMTANGKTITEVQYWSATLCLYSLGYPLSSALSYGMLSKIMGPADQGAMIGWQQVAGSVARITGPIWAGEMFSVRAKKEKVDFFLIKKTFFFFLHAGRRLWFCALLCCWIAVIVCCSPCPCNMETLGSPSRRPGRD